MEIGGVSKSMKGRITHLDGCIVNFGNHQEGFKGCILIIIKKDKKGRHTYLREPDLISYPVEKKHNLVLQVDCSNTDLVI